MERRCGALLHLRSLRLGGRNRRLARLSQLENFHHELVVTEEFPGPASRAAASPRSHSNGSMAPIAPACWVERSQLQQRSLCSRLGGLSRARCSGVVEEELATEFV